MTKVETKFNAKIERMRATGAKVEIKVENCDLLGESRCASIFLPDPLSPGYVFLSFRLTLPPSSKRVNWHRVRRASLSCFAKLNGNRCPEFRAWFYISEYLACTKRLAA